MLSVGCAVTCALDSPCQHMCCVAHRALLRYMSRTTVALLCAFCVSVLSHVNESLRCNDCSRHFWCLPRKAMCGCCCHLFSCSPLHALRVCSCSAQLHYVAEHSNLLDAPLHTLNSVHAGTCKPFVLALPAFTHRQTYCCTHVAFCTDHKHTTPESHQCGTPPVPMLSC